MEQSLVLGLSGWWLLGVTSFTTADDAFGYADAVVGDFDAVTDNCCDGPRKSFALKSYECASVDGYIHNSFRFHFAFLLKNFRMLFRRHSGIKKNMNVKYFSGASSFHHVSAPNFRMTDYCITLCQSSCKHSAQYIMKLSHQGWNVLLEFTDA